MGLVNLLLDTCTFLWLALPQGKLSKRATQLIDDSSNTLFLSDSSLWEICVKHCVGKLDLPDIPKRWLPSRTAFFQLNALPIDHSSIHRSGELPRVHADPFDRLLAAQSIVHKMTLLSPDAPLSLLGASRLW